MSRRKNLVVLSLMLWSIPGTVAMAQDTASSTMITLDRPVHFVAATGGELVAAPGEYTVLAVENSRLLLIPEKGSVPLLIQAQTTQHQENVPSPVVRSVSGDGDEHHILVMLPGGQGRDAAGSYIPAKMRTAVAPPTPPAAKDIPVPSVSTRSVPPPEAPTLPGQTAMSAQSDTRPMRLQERDTQIISPGPPLDERLSSLEMRLGAIERLLSNFESKLGSQLDALDRKLDGLKK